MKERMIRNAIRCAHCGTEIESRFGHDYRTHTCDAMRAVRGPTALIGVDGGLDPLGRRIGHPADWIEASTTDPPIDVVVEERLRQHRIRLVEEQARKELDERDPVARPRE